MSNAGFQTIELVLLASNVILVLAVLTVSVRRRSTPAQLSDLKPDIERLERTIQTNDRESFASAEGRAQALRKEIADNIKLFADQLAASLIAVGDGQKNQLEAFERTLAAQGKAFDGRIAGMSEQQGKALGDFGVSITESGRTLRDEIARSLKSGSDELRTASETAARLQKEKLEDLASGLKEVAETVRQGFEQFRTATESKITEMRRETAEALQAIRTDNEAKLEQMRLTVDEKLQGTLEKRLGESFALVSQQLRQVHEGLGDMQRLAVGVGDLKRVLTNVKSRGTWGETQLAAILEDMLGPDQYQRNVAVKDGSGEVVEFCVKIPTFGENGEAVLLPVDSKFPIEDYERMLACADAGDAAGAEECARKLEARFRACAKDIANKYIAPPRTTEYGVMYIPSEGLYAEIAKRPGLVSSIAREFQVLPAGPTNLMAILNAVHAVARSVTIQQKAGQIAELLLKVESEFVKYGLAVSVAKRRAESTVKAIDSIEQRQRVMGRELKRIRSIDGVSSLALDGLEMLTSADAIESAPTVDLDLDDAETDEPPSELQTGISEQ